MIQSLSESERGLAVVAHLSGLAGYLVPFGGILVPICMMLILSDRSHIVAIAKQAIYLNLAIFVLAVLAVFSMFTVILIPLAWLILALAGPVAVLVPIIGAIKAANGEFWRYPVVGGLV